MTDAKANPVGGISWCDLTIPNAGKLRGFYEAVAGWTSDPVSLGDYEDYSMIPPGQTGEVAGICHAKGVNAEMPPVWLIYITVADLEASLKEVEAQGGAIVHRRKELAVIRDPAGAHCALYQAPEQS